MVTGNGTTARYSSKAWSRHGDEVVACGLHLLDCISEHHSGKLLIHASPGRRRRKTDETDTPKQVRDSFGLNRVTRPIPELDPNGHW